jgi:hypothetical protein
MPNVTINIPQDKIDSLKFALQKENVFSDVDIASAVTLGFEQWLDTIIGRTRFRSMTELYIDWIHRIFSSILPQYDPDEKSLVSRFNMPYGQASYVARVISERVQTHVRR